MEAQQHKNRYQDEGGETKEEAYFNRAHRAILPAASVLGFLTEGNGDRSG
jgi:hypothetical protein